MARPSSLLSPRYSLPYLARNRVWAAKNNRLRRLVALRSRRRQRGGLFRRYVLVSTSRKWTEARASFRPTQYRSGLGRWGGGKVVTGRPQRRRYRDAFYTQQQLRVYHGKLRASTFIRRLVKARRTRAAPQSKVSQALGGQLASRLDSLLVRRRIRPTIFASHQFIRHWGVRINGVRTATPQAQLGVGDTLAFVAPYSGTPRKTTVSFPASSTLHPRRRLQVWRTLAWDLLCRIYYRRWGLYVLQRRLQKKRKKRLRPFRLRGFTSQYRQTSPFSTISQKKVAKWANTKQSAKLFGSQLSTSPANASTLLKSRQPYSAALPARGALSVKLESFKTQSTSIAQKNVLRHAVRVALALRLRTLGLPRVSRLIRSKQRTQLAEGRPSFHFLRPSRRKRLLRSKKGRRRKQARRRATPRLRPVHRRFPSYVQRDLRTLRAVRLRAPASEEEVYPFRGTATTIAAFAHSRGR